MRPSTSTASDSGAAITRDARRDAPAESWGGMHWLLLALAAAIGAYLRFFEIRAQIIADDEWHSLHVIPSRDYGYILTHLAACDYCMPMTFYDKLVSDTIGLTEMRMRAPMLAAGIASTVVLPLLSRSYLGARASITFAWLLAISPLHIYYSRSARPYAIVLLLSIVGVIASERWFASRSPGASRTPVSSGATRVMTAAAKRWAFLYVACAALVPWFHFAYLPFMAAPLAWAVGVAFVSARRDRARFLDRLPPGFFAIVLAIGAGWAVLLGPALWVDGTFSLTRDSMALHGGKAPFRLAPPTDVFELWSGAQRPLLAFTSALALLAGLAAWKKGSRRWMGYLGAIVACEIFAFVVVRPAYIEVPIVFVRYVLPSMVVFLMITAVGLDYLDDRLREDLPRVPRCACIAASIASLLAFGPLWQAYYRPNNWTNDAMFQYRYAPEFRDDFARNVLEISKMPERYAKIASACDADDRVLEAPWCYEWNQIPYVVYQREYRRPMLVGWIDDPAGAVRSGELPWPDARFRFKNCVHLADFEGLRRHHVRFAVLHKNLFCGGDSTDGRDQRPKAMETWIERYRETFGEPFFTDDDTVVFDLKRG
jgi:hypothetical protein